MKSVLFERKLRPVKTRVRLQDNPVAMFLLFSCLI